MEQQGQITDYIKKAKDAGEKAEDEPVLQSYIVGLIQMLNGLNQMENTLSHKYEAKILIQPMMIFSQYFIEALNNILDNKNSETEIKVKDLKEVENAICRISDIYEKIVNNTSNTDKQMLMVAPINATVYPIYPKICGGCIDIINDIISLYTTEEDKKKEKYGFFLNPTLRNTLYVETLFKNRNDKGKIVIINLPVRMMEKMDIIPLCLTHEVFHILTSKERQRKVRAQALLGGLIKQIGYRLFKNVCFSEEDKALDKTIKSMLLDKWMNKLTDDFCKVCDTAKEDDNFFYADSIGKYFEENMNWAMEEIEEGLEIDCLDFVYIKYFQNKKRNSFQYEEKEIIVLINQIEKIKENLMNIRINNIIPYLINQLIFLFRELYSDLACLITSGYDLQLYMDAFEKNTIFNMTNEEFGRDDYHKIRQWMMKKIFQKRTIEKEEEEVYDNEKENSGQKDNKYVIIDKQLSDICVKYLKQCYASIAGILQKKQEQLKEFQEKLERLKNHENEFFL